MTTQLEIEMALLAYMAYSPSDINKIPTGDWHFEYSVENSTTGFAASVYKNTVTGQAR